jgi:hypothetical protein
MHLRIIPQAFQNNNFSFLRRAFSGPALRKRAGS